MEADTEYAMVIVAKTDQHKVWIARSGETDIGGSRTISDTPATGLLYKASNTTSWSVSPAEDLKFSVKTAAFTFDTDGVVALTNDDVPTKTLPKDALIITDASTTMKVRHPDHHMYATTNNVTISGVKSPATVSYTHLTLPTILLV